MNYNQSSNHKKIWTKDEEDKLIFSLKHKDTIKDISIKHNRSENSIKLRLASIFNRELQKGQSKVKICKSFNVTEIFIDNILSFSINFLKETTPSSSTSNSSSYSTHSSSSIDEILKRLDTIEKYVKNIYKKLK